MSKENYKNYFNGGCLTCMFAERDERGRYIGHCSGFSNCSYEEYKGKTDITEEEKDAKITDLEAKLVESEKENQSLKEFIQARENCNEWLTMKDNENLQEENQQLKQQLANKEKEINRICKTHIEANAQLKQQLAEKEEKLKLAEDLLIRQEKEYDEQLEKQAKIHYRHLKEKDQDKIELLENLKQTFAWGKDNGYLTPENAVNIIDQKIKEIGEEK